MKTADKTDKRRQTADTLSAIVQAFADAQRPALPKAAQLCEAISNLIASGDLVEDTKLPGERELCAALGISLGTAQKSLNLLMTDGKLLREHGRGTFVRRGRNALQELWHYRFRDIKTGKLLPVYAKVIERVLVERDPALEAALGVDLGGYIRISRRFDIGGRFHCWSEMYFGATRFRKLLKMPISGVESVNLKQLLDKEFDAPTLAVSQTAKVQVGSKAIAEYLSIPARSSCLLLQVVATSRRHEPITFQKIYVPPVEYELELTDGPAQVARSLAA